MSRDNKDMQPEWDDYDPDWLKELLDEEAPEAAAEPADPAEYQPRHAAAEPAPTPAMDPEPEAKAPAAQARSQAGHIRPTEYVPRGTEEPVYAVEPEEYRPAKKRRGRTSVPLILLIVLLAGGLAFAGWQLGSILLNYHRDRSAYNDLASNAVSALAEKDEAPAYQAQPKDPMASAKVVSQVPINVDWEYLRSVNSDIVGWLYCPDTVVNYPVVQTTDHEFYLKHGFDKSPNTSGTLFADRDSVAGILQSNFIIYGHNMKDKSMFGSFQAYAGESYFVEHPTMYYLTPNGSYRIDLIGAHAVEGTVDNFPTYFEDAEAYQAYLDSITPSFYWINRAAMNTDYQLMTLSTCTAAGGINDARLLVHGVMVPIQ